MVEPLPGTVKAPAAHQVLTVLAHLGRQAGPVPAATVARDLGLPRSTTYQLLAALAATGFVVHLADERRWCLGVAAYELGTGYTRQAPLARVARVPLARLVDRTGHSAHLAVLPRPRGRLRHRGAGPRPPAARHRRRGAAARADDGERPGDARRAAGHAGPGAVPDPGRVRGGTAPASPSALRRLLVDVRRAGHATEDGEVTAGFASVAVAVLDHARHPVAAVAVTFPVGTARPEQLVDTATRTARAITARIGG
jgi:DNA-binding IclR family transcriptional regulator